jgi:thiol-disulfide isomerase/thioredoxin
MKYGYYLPTLRPRHLGGLGAMLVGLTVAAVAGCGQQLESRRSDGGPKAAPTEANHPAEPGRAPRPVPVPVSEIELRTVDIDAFNREMEQHRGKVVLIDFWATWCDKCVENFPHIVELHEKYSAQGLDVTSLSLDDEGDETKAREFLAENGAVFTNLRSEYGAGTESLDKFDLPKSIPHYSLFDRKGTIRAFWNGKPEGIEKKVEELLKEMP